MPKKMLIDATHAEETRVVVVDGNRVEEFDFESENKRQLAGNIYLAKVTRVEPSLQAAFVEYGGNRHGFLAFSEIHPDYYQIPVADREALLAEEAALAADEEAAEEAEKPKKRARGRSRGGARSRTSAEDAANRDATDSREIPGMDVVDFDDGADVDTDDATSPMERVAETPVEEPDRDDGEGETPPEDDEDAGDAASSDEAIESVAEEDVAEEIARPRRPRPRKYKIQEVVKVRQIMLVQVVKEERGNKGAALTTYLSLAGRYCVLMPNTARGGGISRKITNAVDRKKLKEIAAEIDVPKGAGLIVRTAGAKRTKTEIRRDYEYLQRLWEQIRELTLRSIAPAKIYEEGNLIKRSIRDLYSREIDEVVVEGEAGYRTAKDFMKMIMPSHAKNVKHYHESMPLFARHQVESYLSSMFNPTVQLKSGGYIVIGVTEALVAIDVNSGRATKEGSIEETALKTNLEAADEVARQLRLRDLAGLVVVDFIDMDERKNNAAVEKRLKEKLKTDRARIQVGRISGFGLLEMSRQRLRPGMLEASTKPCPSCHGTGLVRSDDSLGLTILRQVEEEGTRRRSAEVLVRAPVAIMNFLMNHKREHIAGIEARTGMSVRVEGDPSLVSPDFAIEKFKTALRPVREMPTVISGDASLMADLEEEEPEVEEAEEAQEAAEDRAPETDETEEQPKKRRRRRRRRRGGGQGEQGGEQEPGETDQADGEARRPEREPVAAADTGDDVGTSEAAEAEDGDGRADEAKPKRTRTRSRRRRSDDAVADAAEAGPVAAQPDVPAESPVAAAAQEEAPSDPPPAPSEAADALPSFATLPDEPARHLDPAAEAEQVAAEEPAEQTEGMTAEERAEPPPSTDAEEPDDARDEPREPEPEQPREAEPAMADGDDAPGKPRRRGWWSIRR